MTPNTYEIINLYIPIMQTDTVGIIGERLRRLKKFRFDWAEEKGREFSRSVIDRVNSLSYELITFGLYDQDIHPGDHGNILLSAYEVERTLEINVLPDGTYDWDIEDTIEECPSEEGVSLSRVIELIKKYKPIN